MRGAGWCAYMQSEMEREQRQQERARRQAARNAWEWEHMSLEKCPKCGGKMYVREGKYGKFLGCADYPNCKGTRQIK